MRLQIQYIKIDTSKFDQLNIDFFFFLCFLEGIKVSFEVYLLKNIIFSTM